MSRSVDRMESFNSLRYVKGMKVKICVVWTDVMRGGEEGQQSEDENDNTKGEWTSGNTE